MRSGTRLESRQAILYTWTDKSTYIKRAPYFDHMADPAAAVSDLSGLRVLALLGDSVTTDHISPAGNIAVDSPAGKYLMSLGVKRRISTRMGPGAGIMR